MRGSALRFVVSLILLALTVSAAAHDARPLSIAILEQGTNAYRVVVRAPPTLEAGNAPRILWPAECDVRESAPHRLALGGTSLVVCDGGLGGRPITVDYPVYNPSITTLFRIQNADGAVTTAVIPPDEATWTVPTAPSWRTVARDYLVLGFGHIWEGPDHLMFVAGFMLLARRPRRILLAVTGFTAAHSITLSLAALGLVSVPVEPVEAMIALSILFLAGEIARGDTGSFSRRYPIALSFVFGLLHGFGFASALGAIGLPTNELATGLLFFNVGVELGQIAFIAAAAVALTAWRSVLRARAGATGPLEARAGGVCAYALGIPAAYWCLERTAAAFAG